ncbi:hypothetical protein VV11_006430, partial [Trichodesmium erythraeum 21-75]|nr:hypothetical protein [Trichodesmium erythraeum 21-75]
MARLNRARGQEGKRAKGYSKVLGGDTHKTKTKNDVVRLDGEIAVAVPRATPPRIAVPGAATNNFSTFSITMCITINP